MGEKFNAPDPGAMQSPTADDAAQRSSYMKMQNPAATIGDPDFDLKQATKLENAKSVDSYMKLENAKSVDSYMKLENAKSDPGAAPDAASSSERSAGYDVKKQDRL
jgi:hypothetical protein